MSRPLCPHCQLPFARCHCHWITPVANRMPVIVWQHPGEQGHAKGTVQLLRDSLQQCTMIVAETLPAGQLPCSRPLLLFPEPAAGNGTSAAANTTAADALLVIDGTWRKARKILHLNPWLLSLPRLSLPSQLPSLYRIRRAEKEGQLSTLEAVCHALQTLEQAPEQYAKLLQAFAGYQQQLQKLRESPDPAP
ncbi:tRNA-uridine aminocarboxypropyltransferase [Pseudomaricurvus sp. HS19]|uniref:tRNA-uridine aminocarboxypropyltransferase n=1 Tax=Pseudomaricurvus sp. HS19 TaxID=2692626 RepID=UPI001367F5FD|nr:DTW domain-containing protein [Pseudomaricurvus sp. HS19]